MNKNAADKSQCNNRITPLLLERRRSKTIGLCWRATSHFERQNARRSWERRQDVRTGASSLPERSLLVGCNFMMIYYKMVRNFLYILCRIGDYVLLTSIISQNSRWNILLNACNCKTYSMCNVRPERTSRLKYF